MESTCLSVCLASYNGINYLPKQIASILSELKDNDELIIVDDSSFDGTLSYLKSISDPRIKLYVNSTNIGVNKTFERALRLSTGKYILLSDQDDIWLPGRVALLLAEIKSNNACLVASNFSHIDKEDDCLVVDTYKPLSRKESSHYFRNMLKIFFGKINYYGCSMILERSILDLVLPIPDYVESHDLWFAAAANIKRSIIHVENFTLLRRIHGKNYSVVSRSIFAKLQSRFVFIRSALVLIFRIYFKSTVLWS
jgi:glycosyltransferase involved in cell wall biosynthesis